MLENLGATDIQLIPHFALRLSSKYHFKISPTLTWSWLYADLWRVWRLTLDDILKILETTTSAERSGENREKLVRIIWDTL